MIARHRGDTRRHSRWRPAAPPAGPATTAPPDLVGGDSAEVHAVDLPHPRLRRSRLLIALATVIAVALIAAQQQTPGTPSLALPSSPRQWVDQWTAASLDNPARVCQRLFAPALAAAFGADTGRSCSRYYTSVNSRSFRIRHVLEDGPTATIEARQVAAPPKWGYFTIVLSHVHGGWQAVDVIPGGSVRPR